MGVSVDQGEAIRDDGVTKQLVELWINTWAKVLYKLHKVFELRNAKLKKVALTNNVEYQDASPLMTGIPALNISNTIVHSSNGKYP